MTIDLRQLFVERQLQLASQLRMARQTIGHPGDKGMVSENEWLELLRRFLPERYRAAKATVIDSIGQTSDSIDIVVYDRQYSPLVFEQAGFLYVAAEAVYAVFEVKQSLNAEHVAYAAHKAASVRRLTRTSAPVVDIRGQTPKKEPIQILAGLLTTDIQWAEDNVEAQLRKHLAPLDAFHKLDLLCAAESFAFDMRQNPDGFHLAASGRDTGLVFFLFGVLERLQMMGTVAPIDFAAYRGAI